MTLTTTKLEEPKNADKTDLCGKFATFCAFWRLLSVLPGRAAFQGAKKIRARGLNKRAKIL